MSGQELLPITKELYLQMSGIAWMMLAPLFLLSCVVEYMGNPEQFPAWDLLKRLVITIFLLTFFPDITALVATISSELANHIGDNQAIDKLYQIIKTQTNPQYQLSKIPFLLSADIGIAFLNYISFALAYLAKFLMIALYHFFWSILMAIAPLCILANLFRNTSHITGRLFSSIIEISTWNVLWQIMAVMLLGLNVVHPTPGNYFDAICFNFLLAIGMIGTPIVIHSLIRSGLSSPSALTTAPVMNLPAQVISPGKVFLNQSTKISSFMKNRMVRANTPGGKNGRTT